MAVTCLRSFITGLCYGAVSAQALSAGRRLSESEMRAVVGRRASRAFLMDWERLHEDLQRAVEELQERSRHAPVIVEGEWDRRSLRALGVVGDIRLVNE